MPRITGLIVGVDSGIGRSTYLTDTMIVVSLDPVAETVSLISIPRDMVDVPLGDGRKYRGKINSLVAYARRSPRQFPGTNGTGFDVLRDALGTLLREPIQYYAKVDLGGFVRVVDTLGGVNVNVARGFCDPKYREYGYPNGFSITAGRHHLNGLQALAYARVRRPLGESDFTRAARQQEVVSGVRDAIVKGDFLNDPVGLLKAIGQTVETDVPRKALPDIGRRRQQGRSLRDVSGGHHAPAGPLRLRQPRVDPDPGPQADQGPGRRTVPGDRHRAAPEVRRPEERRQGQRQRRGWLCARRDPQADPETHAQAEAHLETDGHADARAQRGGILTVPSVG